MKLITIIVPCYNEENSLDLLYERLQNIINRLNRYRFQILFVNDGSRDNTLGKMKELHKNDPMVSYLSLSRNFGKENAMLAGLDFAEGDAVILIDADLQDPPELIQQMVEEWEKGYDDVYAKPGLKKQAPTGITVFCKSLRILISLLTWGISGFLTGRRWMPFARFGNGSVTQKVCSAG